MNQHQNKNIGQGASGMPGPPSGNMGGMQQPLPPAINSAQQPNMNMGQGMPPQPPQPGLNQIGGMNNQARVNLTTQQRYI